VTTCINCENAKYLFDGKCVDDCEARVPPMANSGTGILGRKCVPVVCAPLQQDIDKANARIKELEDMLKDAGISV